MSQVRTIKGTHDILPDDSGLWHKLERNIHENASLFGYKEIRTPIIEQTKLFQRGLGEETDIISKEMYSWQDKDGTSISLRPELTASVVRSYIQHNLGSQAPLQRLYYIGPCFRRERPQKGRQRQFNQFGVEAIGSENAEQDAEVIALGWHILSNMGVKNLDLKISSIGSKICRVKYKEALIKYLNPFKKDLSDLSKHRLKTNPLRILDTKIESEINILRSAPKIEHYYSIEDKEHFNQVKESLNNIGIHFKINQLLVRGLDYYSQTTFEITSNDIGAQDALLGGGRYNSLVKSLGGKNIPAVGFAAGMERILIAAKNTINKIDKKICYIVCLEPNALGSCHRIAQELRSIKINVILETLRRSLKSQLREANKSNAQYAIIIGKDEYAGKFAQIKNLENGNQEKIQQKQILSHFKSLTF